MAFDRINFEIEFPGLSDDYIPPLSSLSHITKHCIDRKRLKEIIHKHIHWGINVFEFDENGFEEFLKELKLE